MSSQLKDDIWEGLVNSDYYLRYYGELAGKLAWRERFASYLVAVLAVSTLGVEIVSANPDEWRPVLILLTAASSIWPLVYRKTGRIARAGFLQHELAAIHDDWKKLWQDCQGEEADELALQEQWSSLTRKMTDSTAMESLEPTPKKLRGATEDANERYWTEYGRKKRSSASKAVATT